MRISIRSNSKSDISDVSFGGGAFVKLFDSLFVLRPTLMFPLWTMTLAGYWLASESDDSYLTVNQWVLIAVAFTAIFGLVYLLNQYRDRATDKQNGKLFLVSDSILSSAHLKVESVILSVTAPIALIYAGFGHLGLWMALILCVAGILYNFTPLAMQNKPWGGILAGAIGGWLLLRLGGKLHGNPAGIFEELPYVIAFASGCLLTGLPDVEGDALTGKRTFSVCYGINVTIAAGLTGFILAAISGFLRMDWTITIPAIAATPLLFVAWRRNSVKLAVSANKLAIFLLALAVGRHFPLFLVIILLYFPFARWYHRQRFGLKYPSLKAD